MIKQKRIYNYISLTYNGFLDAYASPSTTLVELCTLYERTLSEITMGLYLLPLSSKYHAYLLAYKSKLNTLFNERFETFRKDLPNAHI